jgi:hypothetical protein
MKHPLEEQLNGLRRRLITLNGQFKAADNLVAETVENELRNVLQAIAHLEAKIRLEQQYQKGASPIRAASDNGISFERTTEKDLSVIRSACKNCGAVIIASFLNELVELEQSHTACCKKRPQSSDLLKHRKTS